MKRPTVFAMMLFLLLLGRSGMTQTISVTTFAEGLQAPTKIILTEAGNLLVAEGSAVTVDGTILPNTGRLSLLGREGERRFLWEG
jgi:hypothetical protein